MESGALYETIFKRKSIRKYDMMPVDKNFLCELEDYLKSVKPLYENIAVSLEVVSPDKMHGFFAIKAPHYIVVSSEDKEGYAVNAGFMLQQADLFLSSKGFGSCWLGIARPLGEAVAAGMKFVIAMAFGKPNQTLHRKDIAEFIREPLDKISNKKEDGLLESARLAPSASNGQPWFFISDGDRIHAFRSGSNRIKAALMKNLNRIDVGIALCHIWITALHLGRKVEFLKDKKAELDAPAGCEYILSLKT